MKQAQKLRIFVTIETARTLPIVGDWLPVAEWVNGERAGQATLNDCPLWQADVLLKTGWNNSLTPAVIVLASAEKPEITANPAVFAEFLGLSVAPKRGGAE